MAVISHVTGGIAHNFNNLLTGIIGFSDLLAQTSTDKSATLRYVERIVQAAQRGGCLVQQLLAFSQQQVLSPEPVQLNRVVTENAQRLRKGLAHGIELELELEPWPKLIEADQVQLRQILENLTTNALEAMPDGGTLTIRTQALQVNSFSMQHLGIPKGDYMLLAIEDTGHGIEEQIYDQIFEPFFSTKSELNGTGMGLAMVYGLVKQSGGEIRVDSSVGSGTCFTIYFPQSSLSEGTCLSDSFDSKKEHQGESPPTILLAEDDPTIQLVVKSFLSKCGYEVHTVSNGREGIEFTKDHQGEIDMLLTDIVMPEVDGLELAQETLAMRHETKVLFISGFSQEQEVLSDLLGGKAEVDFLKKPFKNKQLGLKVAELIGAAVSTSAQQSAA